MRFAVEDAVGGAIQDLDGYLCEIPVSIRVRPSVSRTGKTAVPLIWSKKLSACIMRPTKVVG
jgi:hypothetical protein